MRKNENVIVEAVSGIDEEVIDRNTEKRIRLLARPRMKRSRIITVAAALVASLAIILSVVLVLTGVGGGGSDNGGGTVPPVIPGRVPIYQGMTVSDSFTALSTAGIDGARRTPMLAPKKPNKNDVKKDKDVSDTLGVVGSTETIYHASVGQDVYVTVHINNPDQYEILSFTLNGKTYSSYMFEEGSDMENLVLKVNVGTVTGVKEYTIDAIKYIDGTEIKDVRMEGDRTVCISVDDGTSPTAQVSLTVGYYTVTLDVEIDDVSEIIEYYGNNIFVALSDADGTLVEIKRLSNGGGKLVFDGLYQGTEYGYAVFAVYLAKGDSSPDVHVLYEGDAMTTSGLGSLGAVWQESSSSFNVTLSVGKGVVVNSAEVLDGDTVVTTLDAALLQSSGSLELSMDELLYDHSYTLRLTYTLDKEQYTHSIGLKTVTLKAPSVSISGVTTGENDMSFVVNITDTDSTADKLTVKVMKGTLIVFTREYTDMSAINGTQITVDGLDDATEYTVRAELSYDLLDGKGAKSVSSFAAEKTKATVSATNMVLRNVGTVYVGDKLLLQITLNNESNATISHVVINGVRYAVASTSTKTLLNVEIDTAGFAGGTHTLTLDALVEGGRVVECAQTLSVTATLSVKFGFVGISIVGEDYTEKVCYDYGETLYLVITLEGGEGSTLTSVVCRSSFNSYTDRTLEDLVKIDDNHYRIPLSSLGSYTSADSVKVYISSLTYVKDSQQATLNVNFNDNASASILPELSDKVVYIYNANDLKNVDDGYHYVLANDIDLGGANWTPVVFKGSLDGNGYAIRNLTYIVANENTASSLSVGLFSSSEGIIYNLALEGIYVNIAYTQTAWADANIEFDLFNRNPDAALALYGCSVDETSSISILPVTSDYGSRMALVSIFDANVISGCSSYASVSIDSGNVMIVNKRAELTDCRIGGNISAKSGVVDMPDFVNCYNESVVELQEKTPYVEGGQLYVGDDLYTKGALFTFVGDDLCYASFRYTFYEGGYAIRGVEEYHGTMIVIPETHDGYPVVAIGYSTSFGADVINDYAFANLTDIVSVVIPSSVTYILGGSFYGCTSLENIIVSGANASFKVVDGTLYSSDGATLVLHPAASPVTDFLIPHGVTAIEAYAFGGCTNLRSVIIPDSVTAIGNRAFLDCTSLVSFDLPDGITSIGGAAFKGCTSLPVNEYGNALYLGSTSNPYLLLYKAKDVSITSCDIHKDTRVIMPSAFSGCTLLTSVYIPDGVLTIGDNAFSRCTALTSLFIPKSVTVIEAFAFDVGFGGNLTLYCETEPIPSGWASNFIGLNSSYVTLLWGQSREE